MKSSATRRALGVTFIYIGVFAALVLLQFGRGGGFSFREGRLSVSASLPRNGGAPESVKVSWPGFKIEISTASPAILTEAGGGRRNLLPRGIERSGKGVRILLQSGVELLALPGSGEGAESYSLMAKAGPAGFTSLSLAGGLAGGVKLADKAGKRLYQSGGASWELKPATLRFGADSSRVVLDARGGGQASLAAIRVETPDHEQKPTAVARAPQDPAAFRATVRAWTDRLWAGLQGERWDETQGAWKEADGSAAFSETSLAVWLAEGFERGQSAESLARAKTAARLHADSIGWQTVPFLGGTIRKMQVLEAQDLLEQKRLATLLAAADPSLFEKEGILHFLLDRTPIDFARSVLAFAAGLDPSKLDRDQLIGLLGCAVEAEGLLGKEENPFPALVAADRIVADIRETDAGIFLVTGEDGSSDFRQSLRAGSLLIAWGGASGQDGLVGLGQGLVESVLALADPRGFLPARGFPRAGSLEEKGGSLAPERVYGLVAAGRWWPREVSFYREAGPGTWAWTCAPSLSLAASPGRALYTASFPTGFEHYLTFYGIKPFTNIKLYGIDYRPDPSFENYNASGYFFRPAAGALHLKMKHKNEQESIDLTF